MECFEALSLNGKEEILRFKATVRYEINMTALNHEEEKPTSDLKSNSEQSQHTD